MTTTIDGLKSVAWVDWKVIMFIAIGLGLLFLIPFIYMKFRRFKVFRRDKDDD